MVPWAGGGEKAALACRIIFAMSCSGHTWPLRWSSAALVVLNIMSSSFRPTISVCVVSVEKFSLDRAVRGIVF